MWAIYLALSSFGKNAHRLGGHGLSWASERGVIVATGFSSLTIQVKASVSEVSAKLDFVFAKNKTFRRTRMYLRRNRFVDWRMHAQKPVGRIIAGINFAKSVLAKLQNITGH